MNKILIVGSGDIAMRCAVILRPRFHLFGLIRNPAYQAKLRGAGIIPLYGDLDQRHSLHHLAGLADTVLHFAPPPAATSAAAPAGSTCVQSGAFTDSRTRNLLAALSRGRLPQRLIYISTSGVYGDCGDEFVTETRPARALSARAKLRTDAESRIRKWAGNNAVQASILRVPGIYAADRLPVERLQKGTPAIVAQEDGYTNHIHAEDLARCVIAALRHAKPNRIYNTCDDSRLKLGDYFDAVAVALGLPLAPRITRAEAQLALTPMQLSFMNESRRLCNTRIKQELKVVLRYPRVADTLAGIKPHYSTAPTVQASVSPRRIQLSLPLF